MGRPKRWCEIDTCGRDAVGWGMCKLHYQRWRRWGDPLRVETKARPETERFWSKVDKTDDCWRWTASTKNGYGCFFLHRPDGRRMEQAHRYAYQLTYGPIPDSVTLDHTCHTRDVSNCRDGSKCHHRSCVRPDHLEPVELAVNIRRGGNATKTHCKRGHEFTRENTYVMKSGGRSCKACLRLHAAATRARKRALTSSG